MAANKRILPYVVLGAVLLIAIIAVIFAGVGGSGIQITGAANCVIWDPEGGPYGYGAYVPCPVVVAPVTQGEEPACGIWQPDVGDAAENGLIDTNDAPPVVILIASNEAGTNIVAQLDTPVAGTTRFSIPEQYRAEGFWFKVRDCGRWHSAEELGLLGD
jgi:hypothetical protein